MNKGTVANATVKLILQGSYGQTFTCNKGKAEQSVFYNQLKMKTRTSEKQKLEHDYTKKLSL